MMNDKQLLVFDLDGTLTESKSYLEKYMRDAVISLLESNYHVGVISGCSYEQMFGQFVVPIIDKVLCKNNIHSTLSRLYLLPTSGSRMYIWNGFERRFQYKYKNDLTLEEKAKIYNAWSSSVLDKDFTTDIYGEVAEDRGSQITFSMCGQKAPLNIKNKYDPEAKIRTNIVRAMKNNIFGYEIKIGGTTSIDVTKTGIDKAYGVDKLMRELDIDKKQVLFIGDSLFDGGNDAVVKKLNIDCKEVEDIYDTLKIIREIMGA